MSAKDRLIVALDTPDRKRCLELIDILSPEVDIFKVGMIPFTGFGQDVLQKLKKLRKKVFLDLKLHDIPNTVEKAVEAAAEKEVFMITVHCAGGRKMLHSAVRGAGEGKAKPLILGVTILTSMDEEDMTDIGFTGHAEEKVLEFARLAREAGLDGVIASPKETRAIKEKFGGEFLVVTPGVRPNWAPSGDQKRTATPKEAVGGGSDYIVIGRPIFEADDPLAAAKKIIEEIET